MSVTRKSIINVTIGAKQQQNVTIDAKQQQNVTIDAKQRHNDIPRRMATKIKTQTVAGFEQNLGYISAKQRTVG